MTSDEELNQAEATLVSAMQELDGLLASRGYPGLQVELWLNRIGRPGRVYYISGADPVGFDWGVQQMPSLSQMLAGLRSKIEALPRLPSATEPPENLWSQGSELSPAEITFADQELWNSYTNQEGN